MISLLFDTSVFICYLRGEDERCAEYIHGVATRSLQGVVSVITITELYAGEKLTANEEKLIDQLLKPFVVIDVDSEISEQAGRIVRKWRRSYGIGLMDALIATTALREEVPVLTLNTKHFRFIPELVTINPCAPD